MEILLRDIRYALRLFRKNPGFALVAALTLALGIGANTAIFSVTNGLLLRPLNVPHPDRMVRVYAVKPSSDVDIISYPNYARLRDGNQSFSVLAAHQHTPVSFSTGSSSDTVNAEVISGNYFRAYGLSPATGRMIFTEDDQKEGAHPVVVISYRLWEKYFQKSNDAVGKKVYLNGHPFQIIGVAPNSFSGSYLTSDDDVWASIAMHEELRPRGIPLATPAWGWLNMTGRLKEGTTIETAQAELNQLALQLRKEFPDTNKGISFRITRASSLPEELSQQLSKGLRFLTVVAGLILLIVCANIAGTLLPRILARRREIAIRNSLGATNGLLIRQWFTESFALCLLGGALGILVAVWCKEGLKLLLPPDWQVFVPAISIDTRVLAFTLIITFLTGIFCGIAPLLHLRKEEIFSGLKGETGGVPRYRLFGLFVSAQTCISLMLLIVAALLLRSLASSTAFELGFSEKNLLLASFETRRHGYADDRGREFIQQLTERLKRFPMVQAVSYAIVTPLDNGSESQGYQIQGQPETIAIDNNSVGPNYFHTLGIPLISGRDFAVEDIHDQSLPVAIVNTTMARKFWPLQNPIGKKLRLEGGPELEIIGVAKDIQYYSVGEKPLPYIYVTPNSVYTGQLTLQIRTNGRPEDFVGTLLNEIKAMDPNVAPFQVMSFLSLRRLQLFPIQALTMISTLIGFVGLVLTSLGIYGVVAYTVAQRTKEIGLRMALGSSRKNILWIILSQGMRFVAAGAVIGILASISAARFLASILFQISPTDFVSYLLTVTLLLLTALIAASIPTHRAMKIDPTIALRYE